MARQSEKIVLQVEESGKMLSTNELDIAQLIAGWVIRDIEGRRQIAEIALTTNDPGVTIVQDEKQPMYDK